MLLSALVVPGLPFVLVSSVDAGAAFCGAEVGQLAARMRSSTHSSSSTRCNTCTATTLTSRNSTNSSVGEGAAPAFVEKYVQLRRSAVAASSADT